MPYYAWLIILSAVFLLAERVRPRVAGQGVFRPGWFRDLVFLVFNGHFLGAWISNLMRPAVAWLEVSAESVAVADGTLRNLLWASTAQAWPFWLQFVVAFLVMDFMQWCIHNLLHRVPWLWEFHKVHHSIEHMDWAGSMRFHWAEIVVYKTLQYMPLVWFGFSGDAIMAVAVIGTAIGHFNHANLNVNIGWLGYVLNNPRMHLWHHAHDEVQARPVNFGINLAVWDWIFGTAYVPAEPPARLGFSNIEQFPHTFVGEELYPLRVESVFRRLFRRSTES